MKCLSRGLLAALILTLALVPMAAAAGKPPTPRHQGVYFYLRRHIEQKFGKHTAGRNIIRDGATDAEVVKANHIYELKLHPPVAKAANGPAIASWYDDSGTTGCGFHATYGIATFVVPCGGHVTLSHDGHTVVATRDDSGPYVAGRMFDLDAVTKAALACSDLCSVYWR